MSAPHDKYPKKPRRDIKTTARNSEQRTTQKSFVETMSKIREAPKLKFILTQSVAFEENVRNERLPENDSVFTKFLKLRVPSTRAK